MSQAGPRKVIWAIDAFDDPDRLRSQAPAVLNAWAKQESIEVLPVYSLKTTEVQASVEPGTEFSPSEYRELARLRLKRSLEQVVRDFPISGLQAPQVIWNHYHSTAHAAKLLASYAQKVNADLILVTSHELHGVRRLFMGSFADALLYRSRVPMLILRPRMTLFDRIRTILIPTPFGHGSKDMFRRIVGEARSLGARIILFHVIPHPVDPILQSGAYLFGGSWIPVQTYFSDESERHKRRADVWAHWARQQGVEVEVIIDAQGGDIGSSILYLASSRKVDLIALESRTGPIASTLIGSITRNVIRNATCPVWAIRVRPGKGVSSKERIQRSAA